VTRVLYVARRERCQALVPVARRWRGYLASGLALAAHRAPQRVGSQLLPRDVEIGEGWHGCRLRPRRAPMSAGPDIRLSTLLHLAQQLASADLGAAFMPSCNFPVLAYIPEYF